MLFVFVSVVCVWLFNLLGFDAVVVVDLVVVTLSLFCLVSCWIWFQPLCVGGLCGVLFVCSCGVELV